MFLILLLITQATAEWVEISQQYYTHKKPLRPHNKPFIEETTTSRYINHSVIEFNWNQGVQRAPNVGNVKRVQLVGNAVQSSPVKVNSLTQVVKSSVTSDEEESFPVEDVSTVQRVTDASMKRVIGTAVKSATAEYGPNIDTHYEFTQDLKPEVEFKSDDNVIGTVRRVPNIGSVKRVQLANTPVKSPSLKMKPETIQEKTTSNSDALRPNYKNNDSFRNSNRKPEFEIINDTKNDEYIENIDVYVGNNKYMIDEKSSNVNNVKKSDKNIISKPVPAINKPEEEFDNYTRMSNIPTSGFITGDGSTESTYFSTDIHPLLDVVTQQNFMKYEHSPNEINQKVFVTKDNILTNSKISAYNNNSQKTNINKKEIQNQFDEESQSTEHGNEDNFEENAGVKENTIENVLKFIKVVADTISSNTRRGVGGKMRYLQKLKDTILANIEYRIDSLWPDDMEHTRDAATRRRSRSTHATARGHVEFPSSEGALMTISFLTFAVFLVKLVLQVIHTYKNKAMMVAPLVVASAGRAAFKDRGRKRN